MRPGAYVVSFRLLGHGPVERAVTVSEPAASAALDLGTIEMSTTAITIDEVTVTATPDPVVYAPDRDIYSVEAMPAAAGGTATDALGQVPDLEVDVNGEVTLADGQLTGRRAGAVTGAMTVFVHRFRGYIFEQPTGLVAVERRSGAAPCSAVARGEYAPAPARHTLCTRFRTTYVYSSAATRSPQRPSLACSDQAARPKRSQRPLVSSSGSSSKPPWLRVKLPIWPVSMTWIPRVFASSFRASHQTVLHRFGTGRSNRLKLRSSAAAGERSSAAIRNGGPFASCYLRLKTSYCTTRDSGPIARQHSSNKPNRRHNRGIMCNMHSVSFSLLRFFWRGNKRSDSLRQMKRHYERDNLA